VTINAVDANGEDEKGNPVEGLPTPALLTEVFRTEPGTEAPAVNIGREGYVWFDVDQIIPPRDRTLDEVRDRVVADWTAEQQSNALTAKADELKNRLEKGETLQTIAGEMGLAVETKLGLRRNSNDALFGRQAVSAIFAGANGLAGTAINEDGSGRILFKVTEVNTNAPADALNNADREIAAIAQSAGEDMVNQMLTRLQNDYGVSINQALADQAMTAY
jgi:peptidyl-prolyl cis-trans isomerase D